MIHPGQISEHSLTYSRFLTATIGVEAIPTIRIPCGLPGDPSHAANHAQPPRRVGLCRPVLGREPGARRRQGDKPTLSGSWGKKDSEPTIEFTREGGLTICPHGDTIAIRI